MKKNHDSWPFFREWLKKTLFLMRLTWLFMLLGFLHVSAAVYSQGERLTLKVSGVTVEQSLRMLGKELHKDFFYSNVQFDTQRKVDLQLDGATIEEALKQVFPGKSVDYSIDGDFVVILNIADSDQSLKSIEIYGKVRDENDLPLPGVTILIKDTNLGFTTDAQGSFKAVVPVSLPVTLVFSSVGYARQERVVRELADFPLSIQLEPEMKEMEEVVVTGIFERKSESFTGSAVTFKSEELKRVGGQNVLQSLRTLDPSFTIMESRDYGSDPNRLPDIEIRGKSSVIGLKEEFGTDPNQPLFILDGFETDLKTVVDMNMDRVASVTILKDAASTAIYGSKAANGVVVIETKKPEPGKFRVTYSGNLYISVPDLSDYNLMNAREKLEFEQRAGRYVSAMGNADEQLFLDSLYNINRAEIARGVDTYWLGEPVRTAVTHKHNIYAEGGDEAIRYGLGFTYNRTNGVMEQSWNELLGANFDLTYR